MAQCKRLDESRWELTGENGRWVVLEDAEVTAIMNAKEHEFHLEDVKAMLEQYSEELDIDNIPEKLIDDITYEYEDNLADQEDWQYSCREAIYHFGDDLEEYLKPKKDR